MIRVQHRERLGAVENEGEAWSAAERRQKAREICRLHFPENDGCPPDVVQGYGDQVLEVHRIVPLTLRVKSPTSHREARTQATALAGPAGPLLSVDGLDVRWLTELDGRRWSGHLSELLARLRDGARDGVGVGPFDCALQVVTQEPGASETFERNLVGRSESSYGDACLDAVQGLCESRRCSVTIAHFDHLPLRDHAPSGRETIFGFPR